MTTEAMTPPGVSSCQPWCEYQDCATDIEGRPQHFEDRTCFGPSHIIGLTAMRGHQELDVFSMFNQYTHRAATVAVSLNDAAETRLTPAEARHLAAALLEAAGEAEQSASAR